MRLRPGAGVVSRTDPGTRAYSSALARHYSPRAPRRPAAPPPWTSTRSETFRTLWARHDVRTHGAGTKRFQHPVVGELVLAYEELAVTAEPGNVLMV